MIELDSFIDELKKEPDFSNGFDEEYQDFKIGYILKQARENVGLTQEELAKIIKTHKGNISRIENHSEDIKLSTLEKYAKALGMKLSINIHF